MEKAHEDIAIGKVLNANQMFMRKKALCKISAINKIIAEILLIFAHINKMQNEYIQPKHNGLRTIAASIRVA